jgi:hypothetical protein
VVEGVEVVEGTSLLRLDHLDILDDLDYSAVQSPIQ